MTSKKTVLTASARAKAGKGAARATRRAGEIPGVIYGDNKEAVLISLPVKELTMVATKKAFFTSLCDLDVGGQKYLTIPRDVQLDGVTDRVIHVDFLRVTDKTIVRVDVPVNVINHKDCPGLSKGGVLNIVRHEISVSCRAAEIPEIFTIDLAGLDVGESIHIGDIELPKGVTPTIQGEFTIITIVAPSAMRSEAEDAATAAATAATAAAAAAAAPAAPTGAPGATPGAAPKAAAPAKGAAPAAAPAKKK